MVLPTTSGGSMHEREALPPLWRFVTFTQNLGLDLRSEGTFSHAWSLCIEEQFYLVLPLVLGALPFWDQLRRQPRAPPSGGSMGPKPTGRWHSRWSGA